MKKIYYSVIDFFYTLFFHRKIIKELQEEAVKPLEVKIKEFQAKANEVKAELESPFLKIFVNHMIDLYKSYPDAVNYLSITATSDKYHEPFEFTIQRKWGKTPSDIAGENQRKIEELENTIKELKSL